MDTTVAEWLNRVGLFSDFLAFWFAAPELIGEERLKILEKALEKAIDPRALYETSPRKLNCCSCFVYAVGGVSAIIWFIAPLYLVGISTIRLFSSGLLDVPSSYDELKQLYWPYWPYCLLILVLMLLAILYGSMVSFSTWLMKWMANDAEIRRRFLIVGAFFFIIGNILQLIATF